METSETVQQHNPRTISGVVRYLIFHPLDAVILRWNWKAAVLSAMLRAPIFLVAYRKEGMALAIGAALSQFLFRTVFGGVNGAIIQAFSKVEPAWHALLTVPFILACFSHIVEFFVQVAYDRYNGTTSGSKAITVSIIISVISAVFNLFAMRRGALLVKDEEQQSLWKDFKSFPRIIFEFLMFAPSLIYRMLRQKQYLQSAATTIVTTIGTAVIAGLLRGKMSWAIVTGTSTFVLIIISIIGIALFRSKKLG
jgi:hypothetical protein